MECVAIPNTNALKQIFPAGENKTKNFFSDSDIEQEKSEIFSMLKLPRIDLTRPSADQHESPAEKNVVASDSVCVQQKMASQTSYDPLEKLSAGFFGMLEDYSRDKALRCDGMEQLLKFVSDRKVTKDTLYQNLVECCKEQEALSPHPPPTKDFSSNLVPTDDGKVLNTNDLKQIFPPGENKTKNFFSDSDIEQEKSEIFSMLKLPRIDLTRPSADQHESPAEKNVVTSDSTRKQQKMASQTSYDPLEKLSAGFFGMLEDHSRDKALRCDGMEQLLKYISDRKVTKDTLYQNLVECCKEQDFDIQQQKSEILSMLKMSGIELGCGGSLVETRPSADKHESPAEKNVVTSDSARVQQKRKKRSPISDDPLQKEDLDVVFGTFQVMLQYKELPCDDMEHVRLCSALCEKQAMKKRRFLKVDDQEN